MKVEGLAIGLVVAVVLVVKANHAEARVDGIAPVVENVGKTAMDDAAGNDPRVAAMAYACRLVMTLLVKE